jgi:hypothetical protein
MKKKLGMAGGKFVEGGILIVFFFFFFLKINTEYRPISFSMFFSPLNSEKKIHFMCVFVGYFGCFIPFSSYCSSTRRSPIFLSCLHY